MWECRPTCQTTSSPSSLFFRGSGCQWAIFDGGRRRNGKKSPTDDVHSMCARRGCVGLYVGFSIAVNINTTVLEYLCYFSKRNILFELSCSSSRVFSVRRPFGVDLFHTRLSERVLECRLQWFECVMMWFLSQQRLM